MELFFEENRTVRAYDVDFLNRMKLSAIFNFLQDAAANQAEKLGFGFDDLKKNNLAWILHWVRLEILESPEFGDDIKVRTWPKSRHKLFSLRDFLIFDSDNNIICRATSAWLLMDIIKKRFADHKLLPQPIHYSPEHALEDLPEKLRNNSERKSVYIKTVKYSDLDINRHTNNTKYVEMAIDSLPDKLLTNSMKSFKINFLAETFLRDSIEILVSANEENYFVEGINSKNNKPVFQSEIEWRK